MIRADRAQERVGGIEAGRVRRLAIGMERVKGGAGALSFV